MDIIIYLLVGAVAFAGGFFMRKYQADEVIKTGELKAEKIIADAKAEQTKLLAESQNKALSILDEAKKDENKRRQEINEMQARLEKRENTFSQKLLELQDKQQQLYDKVNQVEEIKEKVKTIRDEQIKKLEAIAEMSKEQAREQMFANLEADIKDELSSRLKKLENESSDAFEDKARDIMATTMQRLVSNYTTEITTTAVEIPSDEMKGRIIGREGRNIKVIEQLTGTEIIVDDTPNVITVSGFSPIRRHIAKRTLEKLILDGRIHPTKIEDAIEMAKKELAVDIKKAGEEAMYELGIAGFDPKLVQIIGRLKYRTSYGQNALRHCLEVGHLAGMIAEELGADVPLAKKAGLLHDIGKAVDHEVQGTHPEIGGNIAKKFGLTQDIIDPIETHHDDRPRGLMSVIVKVADAISAARPGARHDSFEQYLHRLEELEKIATSFDGIERAYAIQAGREIRIFINAENVDDLGARELAREVAKKIEEELKYPGEIKINAIREMRVIEYAR